MKEIGQLIITGVSGTTLTCEEKDFIGKENIGGVILFSHNYADPTQLAELTNSIQQLRGEYPLFIAVDNEGGRVFRFKEHFSRIPPALDLARLNSPEILFRISQIQAGEYAACGINLNLAPVCDIWSNPKNQVIGDRAYGNDEQTVGKYIPSVIQGLQTGQVMACAKHFPGHGNTVEDSHYQLPVVQRSLEELRRVEFLPFVEAVKSQVKFVMTAHLQVNAIDDKWPSSLSPETYRILRDGLKFTELILTDDMEMQALTDNWSIKEAAVQAINAGADIIEYRSMDKARQALQGLKEAQKKRILSDATIKEHWERVKNCKRDNLSGVRPVQFREMKSRIKQEKSQIFLEDIYAKLASI